MADTLILQLGYILHTVPTWKKVYDMRVLVFVEYESEVEEERGRVKALLEKLRIEAEVLVFWLASGDLLTYETIIHGHFQGPETENLVNDCLRDEEWWEDLQGYRGSRSMSASQEFTSMAHVIESTSGRPGLYNPHTGGSAGAADRRRPSWAAHLNEIPRKPTVSHLVKMGVSMGIHTQNLPVAVLDSSDTDLGSDSDNNVLESDAESVASDGDVAPDMIRRPLLAGLHRRRSYGDVLTRPMSPRRARKPKPSLSRDPPSYGATSSRGRSNEPISRDPSIKGGKDSPRLTPGGTFKLERPPLSRHGSTAMRFTSTLVPETTITNEDGAGPRIMFAETGASASRPGFSRQSSVSRHHTRTGTDEYRPAAADKSVAFAEPPSQGSRTPLARSRRSSPSRRANGGDSLIDIPELLSSYRFGGQEDGDDSGGSSYSTQGLPLSFNDLPSRAQHLILNELMRQQSGETAVLFTTLPIPEEGTCLSEEASLTYLGDVEVLCHELPPVLLVLSNNMTVTVSL